MMDRTEQTLKEELQTMLSQNTETRPVYTVSARSAQDADLETSDLSGLSALQELSYKVELCLKKQQKLRFVTKEISEIVKKSF